MALSCKEGESEGSMAKLRDHTVSRWIADLQTSVKSLIQLVGVAGLEPAAPASRRRCSTKLSYTPKGDEWHV